MRNFLKPNGKKIIIFLSVTFIVVILLFIGGSFPVSYIFYYLFVLPFLLVRGMKNDFDSRLEDPYIVVPLFLFLWMAYFYPLSCLIYHLPRLKHFFPLPKQEFGMQKIPYIALLIRIFALLILAAIVLYSIYEARSAQQEIKEIKQSYERIYQDAPSEEAIGGTDLPIIDPPILDISGWQTYRNDEFGFEVKYPEDWISVDRQRPYSTEKLFTGFRRAEIVPAISDYMDVIIIVNEQIQPINKGGRKMVVDGVDVYVRGTVGDDPIPTKNAYFVHRRNLFWVRGILGENDTNIELIFDQILSTFRFVE